MPRKKVEIKKVGAVKAPTKVVLDGKEFAVKPDKLPTPPPAPVKPKGFVMAPGKALTSLKGILGPGAKVLPEYFQGGQKTFDEFCERGYIVESNK